MDLPVIMLSTNGQTETVLKGINHGACDYLVKPVRIQELKNIWQHVIRRKKSDAQDESNSDGEENSKAQTANSDGGQLPVTTSEESDLNERFNWKRKEQNKEYEDDSKETILEDGSNQKKQRVVWSIELHRKFVDAVNRLGIDRAVPKKILDAMNVEKLTRENVASHLQDRVGANDALDKSPLSRGQSSNTGTFQRKYVNPKSTMMSSVDGTSEQKFEVLDWRRNIIAIGRVHNSNQTTSHGIPFNKEEDVVIADVIYNGEAKLYAPNSFADVLNDVGVGGFMK